MVRGPFLCPRHPKQPKWATKNDSWPNVLPGPGRPDPDLRRGGLTRLQRRVPGRRCGSEPAECRPSGVDAGRPPVWRGVAFLAPGVTRASLVLPEGAVLAGQVQSIAGSGEEEWYLCKSNSYTV